MRLDVGFLQLTNVTCSNTTPHLYNHVAFAILDVEACCFTTQTLRNQSSADVFRTNTEANSSRRNCSRISSLAHAQGSAAGLWPAAYDDGQFVRTAGLLDRIRKSSQEPR